MQIDVTQKLVDYLGNPLLDADKSPVVLRDILVQALGYEDKQKPEFTYSIADKQKAYAASVALFATKMVNLKSDVIELLKPRLNALYSPLLAGQIVELLDDEQSSIGKQIFDITETT